MKKEPGRHRIALALLVSGLVFLILLFAIGIAAIIVYIIAEVNVRLNTSEPKVLILMMGAVSFIMGVALTSIFSKITLKPVNRVISLMNRLASGDFRARLHFGRPIGAHPTFIEISESFNKMALELENTEMLRSDFINNFSHEFKTPIVSIAGFAKLLKKENLTEEQKKEYIDIIEDESLRLASMATNVLTLNKCESKAILTDITTFNLSEQIRSSILSLEGNWVKKNIEFALDFDEYEIEANKELLRNVWLNLIHNAIKFSSDGGLIKINLKENSSYYLINITNFGEAIPKDKIDRIFNKFYQADESHATEGNGIGLALVKSVVTLHKGSISVISENNETTFTITLPKKQI